MQPRMRTVVLAAVLLAAAAAAQASFTRNIMLTGYWPPTNDMLRQFSTNPQQNPGGWAGGNWESRGYDIYSFFPEFPEGIGKGVGDLEVDYQDTSADFWRIVNGVHPIAIITFSRGNWSKTPKWEIEWRQRNLDQWVDDYEEPFQPTPSPPDDSVAAGHIRYSSLPMEEIRDAVNDAQIGETAYIDQTGFCGAFLSEFIAYHGCWYHDLHADQSDPYWNIAAGHIHVSFPVDLDVAVRATEITLRSLTHYLDTQIPEPATALLLLLGLAIARPRNPAAA